MSSIIVILILIISVGIMLYGLAYDSFGWRIFGVILFLICLTIIVSTYEPDNKTPTALDVYRGKTTLQITYKDSIPIDTIVVYK